MDILSLRTAEAANDLAVRKGAAVHGILVNVTETTSLTTSSVETKFLVEVHFTFLVEGRMNGLTGRGRAIEGDKAAGLAVLDLERQLDAIV